MERRTPLPADRELVNRFIFDELTQGELTVETCTQFVRVIEALKLEGCDATALSCTEIPLLITPEDSPLAILDSTRLLARQAVAVALAAAPMPRWRGGAM